MLSLQKYLPIAGWRSTNLFLSTINQVPGLKQECFDIPPGRRKEKEAPCQGVHATNRGPPPRRPCPTQIHTNWAAPSSCQGLPSCDPGEGAPWVPSDLRPLYASPNTLNWNVTSYSSTAEWFLLHPQNKGMPYWFPLSMRKVLKSAGSPSRHKGDQPVCIPHKCFVTTTQSGQEEPAGEKANPGLNFCSECVTSSSVPHKGNKVK